MPVAATGPRAAAPQGVTTAHTASAAPAVLSSNGSGPRHGRTSPRQSPGDTALRLRMVRLAVVPACVVAVAGAAVVAYVMLAEGSTDSSGAPAPGTDGIVLWSVLGAALLLVCGVIFGAAHSAGAQARRTLERQNVLRRSVARGRSDIRALLAGIEQGTYPRPRPLPALAEPGAHADSFDLLTHELAHAQHAAETAVTEAVALVRSSTSGSEEKVEVFVNLARRLQSLVHREIELLDELENEVEDPDLLKGLFHVDHLATRIRRHAENLAVLGGAVSRRQWSRPVTMTEVLRSSIAEVEQYPRVKLVPPIEGTLRGHAVADVIHLLAELVENATVFSAPGTQVLLRAQHVTAGLAIEVEDRGLGMPAAEQNRMNAVLSDPERIDVGELLRDGRIGLFVVSALAQRHGIVVQLQSNIYGGIQAVLVLPREVLGDEPASPAEQSGAVVGPKSAGSGERTRMPRARTESTEHPLPAASESHGALPSQARSAAEAEPAPAEARRQPQPPLRTNGTQPQAQPLPQPRPQVPQTQAQSPVDGASSASGTPAASGFTAAPGPAPAASSSYSSARPGPQPHPQSRTPGQPAPGGALNGERPELPRRRRQEHLAPELREAPPARGTGAGESWDEETQGHDPGLLAAFRRGTSLAEEPGASGPGASGTGATAPGASVPDASYDAAGSGHAAGAYGTPGAYDATSTNDAPGTGSGDAPHPAD
ncbi:sensor histidine kinase [Streptomyces marispadix]|uniref:histidine kinase n=1 Tax=Streptomyces marispadix TaxID=2922868 RepID=A0ABS9T513_9ACTN|nr:ATP-binding protein [Streptomyces marispadix]MCH6163614.1 ATP-binding protein [Streptomyces marispadix]